MNWFEEKVSDSREQGMNEWVHSIMKRVQRINFSSEKRDISSSVIVTDQNIFLCCAAARELEICNVSISSPSKRRAGFVSDSCRLVWKMNDNNVHAATRLSFFPST